MHKVPIALQSATPILIAIEHEPWLKEMFGQGQIRFPCLGQVLHKECSAEPWEAFTSPLHGRSVKLIHRSVDENRNLFAKGIGWTLFPNGLFGWNACLGNIGVLTRKAAIQEFKMAQAFRDRGLDAIEPIAVLGIEPPALTGTGVVDKSNPTVLDIDQTPAVPSVFLYAAPHAHRVCDLFLMTDDERCISLAKAYAALGVVERDFLEAFTIKLARNVGRLHCLGGHNYASSPHNIFVDGTLVDFEYCHLPELLATDLALQGEIGIWQEKEILGWIDALSVLQSIPGVQMPRRGQHILNLFLDTYVEHTGQGVPRELVGFMRARMSAA